jgi:hypothetical protein
MPRVLLCSQNESMGLKVLYCLHAGGYDVDTLSLSRRNATRHSRYGDEFDLLERVGTEPDAQERAVQWINGRARERHWGAVLADDVYSHGFLHEIRDRLSVPAFAPSPRELLVEMHDKWSFYSKVAALGIPAPLSSLVTGPGSVTEREVDAIGYPLLVKPLNGESGHGIQKIASFPALKRYLLTPGLERDFPLKIQRFIAGHTIGLSLLALGGELLAHDVQLHADNGARVFYDDPEVVEIGRRIVKAFGYGGPGHIDFIRDDASRALYALEFNCRFWYSVTVSMWRGGNFPALAVKLARGEAVPESPTRPGPYFQPGTVVGMWKQPGRLLQLDAANWRGFWQAISDPLPHLMHHLR